MDLKGRSFLTLKDYSKEEIRYLLDLSKELKAKKYSGVVGDTLTGKNIVLIFDKTSTRTRCSFEVAINDEGGNVTFLNNSQFNVKESIEDSAKVLGGIYDGIEYRGFEQSIVEQLAEFSNVPVYNGLTDVDHPTQTLADFLTIEECIDKPLNEVKFVFAGDIRNNVCYGLMYGACKMGMDFVCLGPDELEVDQEVLAYCQDEAKASGGSITVTSSLDDIKGADVIYTDIWVSMGEPEELYVTRTEMLKPYKVTQAMMAKTENEDCLFMHCLPSFHDFETKLAKDKIEQGIDIREVEDEVFRSKNSVVFQEAENRMHTIKAVLVATLGKTK